MGWVGKVVRDDGKDMVRVWVVNVSERKEVVVGGRIKVLVEVVVEKEVRVVWVIVNEWFIEIVDGGKLMGC